MSENRLIVRNFGPIKEVEIPLRKVNILIGEPATGKSSISKLLACLLSTEFILFYKIRQKEIFSRLKIQQYFKSNTYINLQYFGISVQYKDKKFQIDFEEDDLIGGANILRFIKTINSEEDFLASVTQDKDYLSLVRSLSNTNHLSQYIPAERILVTSISENPFSFLDSNIKLPEHLLDFGKRYDDARKDIQEIKIDWLNLVYSFSRNKDYISYLNSAKIQLSEAASGFQNLLPIILILEQNAKKKWHGIYLLEEPEISLFPKTQYLFVNYLMSKIKNSANDVLITTHSPYILTTLNNLMYAEKLSKKNSTAVSKVISKKYWINHNDVSAHLLNVKGLAEDVMDYETNQINAEKIDEVSRTINEGYDKLLQIEFSKK